MAATHDAKAVLQSLVNALGLLTAIPLPGSWRGSATARTNAATWFPVVGGALGALAWGADWLLRLAMNPQVAAALTIALLALATGLMHLDGLIDTGDALNGHRSRAQRLTAMRDPPVGAFGVSVVVLLVMVKWAALIGLTDPARLLALMAGGAGSRWAAAFAIGSFRTPAREGLGRA